MAYSYDPIFAVDPNSPSNVARNASILIFDPNDATKTPVTLTDITGSPIENPITVNQHGFGPAIQHPTLDRLAWEGAGMSGVFTSYEGMKEEAVAAREAAQAAATTAAAEAAAGVASVVADAETAATSAAASATAAAQSAALVNAPADTAIAAAINGNGTATKTALSATYATNSVLATAARFPSLDPTGSTSSVAALQAAALATPVGGTLIIPAGRYLCDGKAIDTTGLNAKSITVDATAATFIKAADVSVFSFEGGFDTPISVTATAPTTVSDDTSGTNPGTKITLSSAPPATWVRGTIVKLVADDVIPGGRPGSGGNEARFGQDFIVSSVSGNEVTCLGWLRDPATTNVRIARRRDHAVKVIGGTFETLQSGMGGSWTSGMVEFRGLIRPSMSDYTINSTPGAGVIYRGCYGYSDDNGNLAYAKNATVSGNNGYGIFDISSTFGRVSNYRASRTRHAFTDGSPFIPANSSFIENYGRSYGAIIAGGVSYGSANTSWDTHSWSENMTFTDCVSIDSYKGVGLRGRKHRVINCSAVRTHSAGVSIFSEPEGGESWGHEVVNFIADGVLTRSLEVSLNPTGHPSANVNEPRMSYINGISVRNAAGEGININNGDVRIDNLDYISGPEVSGTRLFVSRNGKVEGSRWRQDLRQVTTGTGVSLLRLESGATADIGEWDYVTTSANAGKITYAIHTESSSIVANVRKLTMSHPPGTFIYNSLGAGSKVDWEYLSNGETSSYISVADSTISGATGTVTSISRTRAPEVLVRMNASTGAQTMPPFLSGAFRGQRLRLWNVSTSNAITVPHGTATYKTFLSSGADTVLNPNQQILLVWINTTWWQI